MANNEGMKTVKGDLIELAKAGDFDVIVHGCNCYCKMGSGVARAIRDAFPDAYKIDRLTKKGDKGKLGTITSARCWVTDDIEDVVTVVNAYTQYSYGTNKRHVDYDAVRSCFKEIKHYFAGWRIGFPAIGAGLGGGDWEIISKIISEELEDEDYTLVVL